MIRRVNSALIFSSKDLTELESYCLYFRTVCCSCWSLTFEIIIYDPKQLSGLGLS